MDLQSPWLELCSVYQDLLVDKSNLFTHLDNRPMTDCVLLVIAMIPPTLYYSRVGLELGKLVFRGQNMSPP